MGVRTTTAIPGYHCLILGGTACLNSAHISSIFDRSNDEAAIAAAKRLVDGHDVELGQDARKVTTERMASGRDMKWKPPKPPK